MGTRKPSRQTLQVLAALLDKQYDDHYGLELAKAAGLASGSLYPILARLERCGWLESEWEDIDESKEGRRRRRYYRLTGDGVRHAQEELADLRKLFSPALGLGQ